jgi:Mg2+ and Co2+ transporter CorA
VTELQRATKPLVPVLEGLMSVPQIHEEERSYLRDVQDHALRVQEPSVKRRTKPFAPTPVAMSE